MLQHTSFHGAGKACLETKNPAEAGSFVLPGRVLPAAVLPSCGAGSSMPGLRIPIRAPCLAHASAAEEVDDPEQDHRADERDDEARDAEAGIDVGAFRFLFVAWIEESGSNERNIATHARVTIFINHIRSIRIQVTIRFGNGNDPGGSE